LRPGYWEVYLRHLREREKIEPFAEEGGNRKNRVWFEEIYVMEYPLYRKEWKKV